MLLGIGRVTGMTDTGLTQTLQFRTPLDVMSAHRLAEFGFSSAPPIGSDVLVASLGGDRSSPIVIATNHRGSRLTGLKAGETAIYNQTGMYVKLTASGIEVEAKGQSVTVSDATTVTINASTGVVMNTPSLKVSGDVIDNTGSGNASTLKQLRDAYNDHTHAVKGVQTGSSQVTSEAPGTEVG
ncbi:phage baseplate assembly protein V [Pantoea stewartii subsp. stewartii]|nr:phage baseplate assembly protein V [Pantoea stewartii subsp. stewartii]